jgi:ribonuclease HI
LILDVDGSPLAEGSLPLGRTTVGVAEYRALIAGLRAALDLGLSRIQVVSDSQFMCRQLQGQYRVRTPAIRPLFEKAQELIGRFADLEICHTEREHNERADALAKAAARRSRQG